MRKTPSVLSSPNNRCTGARRKRVSTEYHHFKSPGNLNNCLLGPEIIPITWRPVTRKLAEFQEIKLCYFIGGPSTILLKGTQVEFNCPKECLTFLESPWGEDSTGKLGIMVRATSLLNSDFNSSSWTLWDPLGGSQKVPDGPRGTQRRN